MWKRWFASAMGVGFTLQALTLEIFGPEKSQGLRKAMSATQSVAINHEKTGRKIEKTPADRAFLEKLSSIEFGPLAYKLINPEEGEGWSLERATKAIEQYRRFLFLVYRYPEQRIVPSREVDEVWHTHILDTMKYREDCDLLFAKFMDHWPYFGLKDAEERQELNDAFDETKQLFEKHFGAAD